MMARGWILCLSMVIQKTYPNSKLSHEITQVFPYYQVWPCACLHPCVCVKARMCVCICMRVHPDAYMLQVCCPPCFLVLLKIYLFILFMCMCVHACVSLWAPYAEARRGCEIPGSWYELPDVGMLWDLSQDPQKQQPLGTSGPSFQTPPCFERGSLTDFELTK